MTEEEIKIADWIIRRYNMNPTGFGELHPSNRRIAKYLVDEGFITLSSGMIALTPKGEQFQKSGKSYGEYLNEKKVKAERDDRHKDLQIQDLETKLKVMNAEQLKFWHRQRWQFWLTFMVASAAFILSIINFIKSLIIK
jgi:hypothetical protein